MWDGTFEGWVAPLAAFWTEYRTGIVIVGILLAIFIFEHINTKRRIDAMGTNDDSADDISLLTEFINALPQSIQDSVANGTISMTIRWAEVTRDEDDWPTIKPVVEFNSSKS